MNDEIYLNYSRMVNTSQRIMGDVISVINHQETTLRRLVNRDIDDLHSTIQTLRTENQQLRNNINSRRNSYIPQEPRARTEQPRMFSQPRIYTRPINSEDQNLLGIDPLRQRTTTTVPNNQNSFVRRYLTNLPDLVFGANQNLATDINPFRELSPVIVRPTDRQIRDATQLLRYGNIVDAPNNRCPISLEVFNETDLVTRIVFCGHVFSTTELQTWFETNVRCPLCRFDIREHRNRISINNLSTVLESENENENENNNDNSNGNNVNDEESQENNNNINLLGNQRINNNNIDNLISHADNMINNELAALASMTFPNLLNQSLDISTNIVRNYINSPMSSNSDISNNSFYV